MSGAHSANPTRHRSRVSQRNCVRQIDFRNKLPLE